MTELVLDTVKLSLRAEVAMRALSGLVAGNPSISAVGAAKRSIEYADALIAELEKPK